MKKEKEIVLTQNGKFLVLSKPKWNARKPFSKKRRKEIAEREGIDPAALATFTKNLADPEFIRPVAALDNKVASYLGKKCSTKLGSAYYISDSMQPKVIEKLEAWKDERAELVDDVVNKYDELLAKAKEILKDDFDNSEYPADEEELRAEFGFSWSFFTLRDYTSSHLTKRFEELVEHIVERLTGENEHGNRKTFRDTLVTKTLEFCEDFNDLCLDGDTLLKEMVGEVRELLGGIKISDIRYDDDVRNNVTNKFASIQQGLQKVIDADPVRAISLDD